MHLGDEKGLIVYIVQGSHGGLPLRHYLHVDLRREQAPVPAKQGVPVP